MFIKTTLTETALNAIALHVDPNPESHICFKIVSIEIFLGETFKFQYLTT